MKTKEKIAIMQAFADGKPIQYKFKDNPTNKWMDFSECVEPSWNWDLVDFRVKPEPKVRPYTFEEMCEAVSKHGALVRTKDKAVYTVIYFDEEIVSYLHDITETYAEFMSKNVWLDDNSPCGVVEE